MILDLRTQIGVGSQFLVVDRDTGKPIPHVWYADDEKGIYRVSLRDAQGKRYADEHGAMAWEERKGNILIVYRGPTRRLAAAVGED